MKALMVGGPRNGNMVTVSQYVAVDKLAAPDDVWPPVWVDVMTAQAYRRFPMHYMEMSTLVPNVVQTRWDAVVYVHESIRTDAALGVAFPQAAALWWFRETARPSNPRDPRPFTDEQPANTENTEETPA